MKTGPKAITLKVGPTPCLFGTVKAPPSKSYTHRAILVASLNGKARIVNPLHCEDTRHTIAMCRKLGARIEKRGNSLIVEGCAGRPRLAGGTVNVGESGTLLRFSLPSLALTGRPVLVTGKGTLKERPNRQIVEVLRAWGVNIRGRGDDHKLPIHIESDGVLKGRKATVEGSVTSQVVSSLLISAPFAQNDTVLHLPRRLVSRPYVDITLDVLKWAGIRVDRKGYKLFRVRKGRRVKAGLEFTVHGDYSSAAFLLTAAVLLESNVRITDLVEDAQGDRRILEILRDMGARIVHSHGRVTVKGPFKLRGIDIDGSDIPDLVPVLAVAGCFASGTTRIRNVAHLAHKESNRLAKPAVELRKLGARISFTRDELVIRHSTLHGGRVSSCNDHRIAMALTVAGLAMGGGVTITGVECVSKSYPRFVSDMKKLHAVLLSSAR